MLVKTLDSARLDLKIKQEINEAIHTLSNVCHCPLANQSCVMKRSFIVIYWTYARIVECKCNEPGDFIVLQLGRDGTGLNCREENLPTDIHIHTGASRYLVLKPCVFMPHRDQLQKLQSQNYQNPITDTKILCGCSTRDKIGDIKIREYCILIIAL